MPRFSFLLPTRGRPGPLRRLLESLRDTAQCPGDVEVVLCVDEDDPESHHVSLDGLSVTTVIVPPGARMGELNRAAFAASSGRFVMLINDDVVARTNHWDRAIYQAFDSLGDDVGLIHANDLLFREKLCTFPILSRIACLEIGVCPPQYRRYRIDDHIGETYNMLAHLGHRRILYLSDVVFEHLNFSDHVQGEAGQVFESEDRKIYQPNQAILEEDAVEYDRRFDERKADAHALAMLIERLGVAKKTSAYQRRLDSVDRAFGQRRGEFTRPFPASSAPGLINRATVTVAVVTAGLDRPHARECLELLKRHIGGVDLIVLDNNASPAFNHPREMNKVLDTARTDYALLLDDDVFVESGLEGLLKAMDADTGLAGPLHRDRSGKVSHSGVYLAGDDWGTHAHLTDVPTLPRVAQCLCSACILIDLRKCGHLRFNEAYSKYFLDLDFSLQVWEAGCKVVCSPYSTVTHLAGATVPHGSRSSLEQWERDMVIFRNDWITSGRLERVQERFLARYPFLLLLASLPRRIRAMLGQESWEVLEFQRELSRLVEYAKPFPLFESLLVLELGRLADRCRERGDALKEESCRTVLKRLEGIPPLVSGPAPILLESYRQHNVVSYHGSILAVPQALGPIDLRVTENRSRPGILAASTLDEVKRGIDAITPASPPVEVDGSSLAPAVLLHSYRGYNLVAFDGMVYGVPVVLGPFKLQVGDNRYRPEILCGENVDAVQARVDAWLSAAIGTRSEGDAPVLVSEGHKGFNVVRWQGRFFAIPQGEGAFDPRRFEERQYSRSVAGGTLAEVKTLIDRQAVPFIWRAAHKVRRRLATGFLC